MFTTYASPGQLEAAVDQAKANIEMLTANNVKADPNLVGENWIINSAGAVDIQTKMGGTILR